MSKTYGDSFVERLGAQDLKLVDSTTTGANSVAAGDVVMLAPSNHWSNTPLIEQGAPIVDAHPAPTTGTEQWMGMVRNAPHPNAAQLFVNYALSPEGQTAECTNLCTSVLSAPGAIPLPVGYVSPPLEAADAQKADLLALLGIQ
jgi:iron(III) transport system substrate-binding protein